MGEIFEYICNINGAANVNDIRHAAFEALRERYMSEDKKVEIIDEFISYDNKFVIFTFKVTKRFKVTIGKAVFDVD